jgi:hypothetical protein
LSHHTQANIAQQLWAEGAAYAKASVEMKAQSLARSRPSVGCRYSGRVLESDTKREYRIHSQASPTRWI